MMNLLNELKKLWFFYFFIIALFLFNSFQIGPFTIRVYATIIMAILLALGYLKNRNRLNLIPISSSEVNIYIAFLGVMSICLLLNGEFSEYSFLKRLFAYHLPCLVVFFAISSKIDTYDTVRYTIIVLCALLIFDEIITVLQAEGNVAAWGIGITLSPLDNIKERADAHEDFLGFSVIPGLFGGVVKNAFYITSLAPLSLAFLNKKKSTINFVLIIALQALSLYAIFITQQRAAFYIYGLSLLIFLFISAIKKPVIILMGIIVALLISTNFVSYIQTLDVGRLSDSYDTGRNAIYQQAFDFIPEHLFLGGPASFLKIAGLPAHNLFIDGIISAGIIGLILLVLYTYKTLKKVLLSFYDYFYNKCSIVTVAIALALLSSTLYGFSHNTSVLTGEPILFILWALLLKSLYIDKNKMSYDTI